MAIGWIHPIDNAKEWKGINNPGMEWFRSKPLIKFTREGIQNSLDSNPDPSRSQTITVEFKYDEVEISAIPDIDQLKNNIKNALYSHIDKNGSTSTASKKVVNTYNKALNALDRDKLPIFRISDSSTTGMDSETFYSYMKGEGLSQKEDGSGGSYGIGKMAPYVVSDLRTIIASTVYEDNGRCYQLTQGKSVLSTFVEDSNHYAATGYWGNDEEFTPLGGVDSRLPDWVQHSNIEQLSRKDLGTTITVLGFQEELQVYWHEKVALAVIENFFVAIFDGSLEVNVGGKYRLNKETLLDTVNDPDFIQKIQQSSGEDGIDRLTLSRKYLSLLSNEPGTIVREARLSYLGYCELRLKVDDDSPKNLCFVRNGIFITEKQDRFNRFPGLKPFLSIFQCLDPRGNELLRQMENPSHDQFEPDRPSEDQVKERAKKAMKELRAWIFEQLKNYAKNKPKGVTNIENLNKWFGYEGEEGEGGIDEPNPDGNTIILERIKPRRPPPPKIPSIEPDDPPDPPNPDPPTPGPPTPGPRPKARLIPQEIENPRLIRQGQNKFKFILTPIFSGEAFIRLYKSGSDSSERLKVHTFNDEELINGDFKTDFKNGERCEIDFSLHEEFKGAMEIYLVKKVEANAE